MTYLETNGLILLIRPFDSLERVGVSCFWADMIVELDCSGVSVAMVHVDF